MLLDVVFVNFFQVGETSSSQLYYVHTVQEVNNEEFRRVISSNQDTIQFL